MYVRVMTFEHPCMLAERRYHCETQTGEFTRLPPLSPSVNSKQPCMTTNVYLDTSTVHTQTTHIPRTHVYIYIYTCTSTYVHVIYICIYMYIYICTCTSLHTCTCIHSQPLELQNYTVFRCIAQLYVLYMYYTCIIMYNEDVRIFSRKSDCLGCAVALPCLFDLACFFLSFISH